MKKRVIALMQARTDSTRLPFKVLKKILNKPMILHQIERTVKSKCIDNFLLVTSNDKSDDKLAEIVNKNGFEVFRGDKNNVLKRFYDALLKYDLDDNDIVVRLTGDCPLHDSNIIDESIKEFILQKCDYLANCVEPIYPDGFDVEVFNFKSLKIAYNEAVKESDKEHVTPYIRNNKKFIVKNLEKLPIHNDWRLTVDEPSDFNLILKIFEKFNSNSFDFEDIINYLTKNNDLLTINSHINRNEGYLKSIKEENKSAR